MKREQTLVAHSRDGQHAQPPLAPRVLGVEGPHRRALGVKVHLGPQLLLMQ